MKSRNYSNTDNLLIRLDQFAKKLDGKQALKSERHYPAEECAEGHLNQEQKRHIAGLMRVNHAGEIAAQALYQAQALTARDPELKKVMKQSALEEEDHLKWCQQRLQELNDRGSYLGPLWYGGSFSIGLLAGSFGDKWNLGFLEETENQVVKHLDSHLRLIPATDKRSRAVLEQMRDDENQHATKARESGAESLPFGIKLLMKLSSKVMTKTAYWI